MDRNITLTAYIHAYSNTNKLDPFKFKPADLQAVGATSSNGYYYSNLIPVVPGTEYKIVTPNIALTSYLTPYTAGKTAETDETSINADYFMYTPVTGVRFVRLKVYIGTYDELTISGSDYGFFEGDSTTEFQSFFNEYDIQPVYDDDLAISEEMEDDYYFKRRKISKSLTFVGAEADTLVNNVGMQSTCYFNIVDNTGIEPDLLTRFTRRSIDAKDYGEYGSVEVKLTTVDEYTGILDYIKEDVDVIDLSVKTESVFFKADAILQIYLANSSVITCITPGGVYFNIELTDDDFTPAELISDYHFTVPSSGTGIYTRMLTKASTVSGYTLYDHTSSDVAYVKNYDYHFAYDPGSAYIQSDSSDSVDATIYGRKDESTLYFAEYTSTLGVTVPICYPYWGDTAWWLVMTDSLRTFMYSISEDVELVPAMAIDVAIQALLDYHDVGVKVKISDDVSQFLYAATNPIDQVTSVDISDLSAYFVANPRLFITQISNLQTISGDDYAQDLEISLNDLLNEVLYKAFNCSWHIENGYLRIEHSKYYLLGMSYASQVEGEDITEKYETHTRKPWIFARGGWYYDEEDTPAGYKFGWGNECSKEFELANIEVVSVLSERNVTEDKSVGFTTDIDKVVVDYNNVSSDGFVLLAVDDSNYVFHTPASDGSDRVLNNGYLSWRTLFNTYHKINFPSKTLKLEESLVSLSETINKSKKQKLEFPAFTYLADFVPIKTDLGSGMVYSRKKKISTGMQELIILHDDDE